ncbi:MAG: lysylphosphatidylglycerol synthase transmembrane domain-containing protein [Methylococcales bacterium]
METIKSTVQETSKNPKSRRGWLGFALRAILTIVILTALILWLPTDQLWAATKSTGINLWGLTIVCVVLFQIIAVWKWRILLLASELPVRWLESMRAHTAGLFANIWLPSISGGDVVRLGLVVKNKKQLASAFTGTAADRANDVVALLLLAAVGILWLPVIKANLGTRALGFITVLIVSTLLSAPAFLKYVRADWFPQRIAGAVTALKTALSSILSRKKTLILAQSLSLLIQGVFVLLNAVIGQAMGIQIPLSAWFVAWPLAKLAAMVPVSLGGIGVREAAMAALLAVFYVDPTLSVAQSLVWESIMLALGLIAGAVSLYLGRILQRKELNRDLDSKITANNTL